MTPADAKLKPWSCGPAQRADPEAEAAVDWIFETLLADLDPAVSKDWLAEELWTRMGAHAGLQEAFLAWLGQGPR